MGEGKTWPSRIAVCPETLCDSQGKGLFGITHLKTEKRVDWVDWKTYKKVKYRPYSIEEMMFYDDLFGD